MKLPLLEHAPIYVTDSWIRQNPPSTQTPHKILYAGDGPEPPFDAISQFLGPIMEEYKSNRTASDGVLSIVLHRAFTLTRRQAADMRWWHYLSIIQYPAYVSWRYFDTKVGYTNKSRFLGPMDENAFARLWWWAELTVNRFSEDPYDLTRRGAENLEFVKGVLENLFGGNAALVRTLFLRLFMNGTRPSDQQVKDAFTKINALLVTVAIDALNEMEIQELVAGI